MFSIRDICRQYNVGIGYTECVPSSGLARHFLARAMWNGAVVAEAYAFGKDEAGKLAIFAALRSGPLADCLARDRADLDQRDRSKFEAAPPAKDAPFCRAWPTMLEIAVQYAKLIHAAAVKALEERKLPALFLDDDARAWIAKNLDELGILARSVDDDLIETVRSLKAEAAVRDQLAKGDGIRPVEHVESDLEAARRVVAALEEELAKAKDYTIHLTSARVGLSEARAVFSIPLLIGSPMGAAGVPGRGGVPRECEGGIATNDGPRAAPAKVEPSPAVLTRAKERRNAAADRIEEAAAN